jgi:ribosomal protein L19
MKINPTLQKFESRLVLLKSKYQFHRQVSRGDIVSVIYFDLEKEQVRLQQFTGVCKSFKSRGVNTKLTVVNIVGKVTVEQQFFLYSKVISDVVIVRKMSKRKNDTQKKV